MDSLVMECESVPEPTNEVSYFDAVTPEQVEDYPQQSPSRRRRKSTTPMKCDPDDNDGESDKTSVNSELSDPSVTTSVVTNHHNVGLRLAKRRKIYTGDQDVNRRTFPCGYCDNVFASKYKLERHHRRIHMSEAPLGDDLQIETYGSPYKTEEHSGQDEMIETSSDIVINMLNKDSNSGNEFVKLAESDEESSIIRVGSSQHGMKNDENSVIKSNAKKFKCNECQKMFNTAMLRNRHFSRMHMYLAFKCKYCDKLCADEQLLKAHQYLHVGVKPYKCSQCHSECSTEANMKKHNVMFHSDPVKKRYRYISRSRPQYKVHYFRSCIATRDRKKSLAVNVRMDLKIDVLQKRKSDLFCVISPTEKDVMPLDQTDVLNDIDTDANRALDVEEKSVIGMASPGISSLPVFPNNIPAESESDESEEEASSIQVGSRQPLNNDKAEITTTATHQGVNHNLSISNFAQNEHQNNEQQNSRKQNKMFRCSYCGKLCHCWSKLVIHERVHTGEKPHECKQCGKRFAFKRTLETHTYFHTGDKPYKCTQCDSTFVTSSHLKRHFATLHEDCLKPDWTTCFVKPDIPDDDYEERKTRYKCYYCDRTFSKQSYMLQHVRAHKDGQPIVYECRFCQRRLTTRGGLKAHERTHTGERPHACRECGKTFARACDVNRHYQNVHVKQKSSSFPCEHCNKVFRYRVRWLRHQKRHSENNTGYLREDKNIAFNVVNKNENDTGGINFNSPHQDSIDVHEGDSKYDSSKTEPESDNEEMSSVNFEDSTRELNENLETKINQSSVISCEIEKPFHCEYCDESFAQKGALTKHTYIHTGVDKPHKCQDCGAAFVLQASLKRHITGVHIQGKPLKPYIRDVHRHVGTITSSDSRAPLSSHCNRQFIEVSSTVLKHPSACEKFDHDMNENLDSSHPEIEFKESNQDIVKVDPDAVDAAHRNMFKIESDFEAQENDINHEIIESTSVINNPTVKQNHFIEPEIDQKYESVVNTTESDSDSGSNNVNKSWTCEHCGRTNFSRKSQYIRHLRVHTGEKPYKCKMCEKSFATCGTLITHERTHTGEKPYLCRLCGKGFSTSSGVNRHATRVHTERKPGTTPPKSCDMFTCTDCGEDFSTVRGLNVHSHFHKVHQHKCEMCDINFASLQNLKKHKESVHGVKPFSCDCCDATFSWRKSFLVHSRTIHGKNVK